VIAGTASVVAGNVQHRQQQKWAQQSQDAYDQQQAELAAQEQTYAAQQAAAAPPPGEVDYTAELEKLANLKQQGIITEEEFQAKKKQILGI
jgi:hypothetical protein